MSSFLNRLKNLKTGSLSSHNNEGDSNSICSFDEEGFLCPICHRKFPDTTGLEHHYSQVHCQPTSNSTYENTNGSQNANHHGLVDDPTQELAIWKEQLLTSEESRMNLSSELIQQKQRVGDLEDELHSLQKQLRSTQMKVVEQSKEIGNLKATKDVYGAQLAMFTDELLNTQDELKEKQNQVTTLCNDLIPRPTNDDVAVLKHELISVQQRMNDMSLEKEQEIERLHHVLQDSYQSIGQLDQFNTSLDQNVNIYEELINQQTSEITSELHVIKPLIHSIRERKQTLESSWKSLRTHLDQNEKDIEQLKQTNAQLHLDLEHQIQSNQQLTNDIETEQKLNKASRTQIDTLTGEIQELEKSLEDLKQEKSQLLQTRMNDEQDDDRQDLLRHLTQEKDQYEQQTKDLRKQLKQVNEEKEKVQEELQNVSQQMTRVNEEKNQLQDDCSQLNQTVEALRKQCDDVNQEKDQQLNTLHQELSTAREEHTDTHRRSEDALREASEQIEKYQQEGSRLEDELQEVNLRLSEQLDRNKQLSSEQEELCNESQLQLQSVQTQHNERQSQLERTIEELETKIDQKQNSIDRLSAGIRRQTEVLKKMAVHLEESVPTSQQKLLEMIEQSGEESQTIRAETLENIRSEFTLCLTVIQALILDRKAQLDQQIEEHKSKLVEVQQHAEQELAAMKDQHEEQKQKLEIQLGELNNNLLQVSESLSQATQEADQERDKFEQRVASLEDELTKGRTDLESRTKKYDMQLAALTENLATVRGELKNIQEKLVHFDQLKTEKADLEARLVVGQDERHALLERSLANENQNKQLLREKEELTRKNTDLESALQELAREYQGLQIHTNTITERRWLKDDDVHECMKCSQTFSLTQRKHHCRSCGNIFCERCSSKTAIVAATSSKPQRVCDQCFKDLTS